MKNDKMVLHINNFKKEIEFSEYTLNRLIRQLLSNITPTKDLRDILLETDKKYGGIIIGTEQLKLDPLYSIEFVDIIKSSEKYKNAILEFKHKSIDNIKFSEYSTYINIEDVNKYYVAISVINDIIHSLINN